MREFSAEVVGEFGYDDFMDALFTRTYLEQAALELEITQGDHEYYAIRASMSSSVFLRVTIRISSLSNPSQCWRSIGRTKFLVDASNPDGGALGYEVCRMVRAVRGLKY